MEVPMFRNFIRVIILTISVFLSINSNSATLSGTLKVFTSDNFSNPDLIKTMHILETSEKTWNLEFNRNPIQLRSGMTISITGYPIGTKSFQVDTFQIISENKIIRSKRSILYLIVDMNDDKGSDKVSVSQAEDTAEEIRTRYLKLSNGNIEFVKDTDGDSKTDVYQVEIDANATTNCNYHDWAKKSLEAAEKKGVNTELFSHRVFILPKSVKCWWAGLASGGLASQA